MSGQDTGDPQKRIDELKKQKDLLDAQKNLIEAQRALEKAQQPVDSRLDDLKNQKAVADAKKDLLTSQTDALKAELIGSVTGGPFSGSVEMKAGAGAAEANLLASQAIRSAAVRIVGQIETFVSERPIFLFSVKDFPTFQRLAAFRFRKEIVKQAYHSAGIGAGVEEAALHALPALGSGALDAISKILGFFKADFTVGGTEVKADETQLLFALAGRFGDHEVHLPAIYNPSAQAGAVQEMTGALSDLAPLRVNANNAINALSDEIEKLEKENHDAHKQQIASKKTKLDLLKTVVALHDGFWTSLTTPDSSGLLPIALLAQEIAIDGALNNGGVALLVKLENAAGGYFVKKNFLTGLGAMPLYHMGGSTASYVLLCGKQGKVLASDVVPVYGGFVRAGDVEKTLSQTPR